MPRPPAYPDDRLLRTIRRELLAAGASELRLREVCLELGVSLPSVQNRLGSRAEILAQIWLSAWEDYQSRVLTALANEPRKREAARRAIVALADYCYDDPDGGELIVTFTGNALLGTRWPDRHAEWKRDLDSRLDAGLRAFARRWAGKLHADRLALIRLALIEGPLAQLRSQGFPLEKPSLRIDDFLRLLERARD